MRASQINDCAYCIDMRSKDARPLDTEQRPYALNAWHKTPFFTAHERAALAVIDRGRRTPASARSLATVVHGSDGDSVSVGEAWVMLGGDPTKIPLTQKEDR